MGKEMHPEHPWQQSPKELFMYALKHLEGINDDPEFDNRMAFLILDIGVETLFKVYLSLPDEVIQTTVHYSERCGAIKGGFHKLVQCVKACTENRLSNINLNHILYYHRLRNKLYHESDSITISRKNTIRYARLAIEMLKTLLDVDLSKELDEIDNKGAHIEPQEDKRIYDNYEKVLKLEVRALKSLHKELELCLETLLPNIVLPSFKSALNELDPLDPAVAMRAICEIVERTFELDDIVDYVSDNDIEFVNNHLLKTSGMGLSQYPSKKDIIVAVTSGFLGWENTSFKNLPVEEFRVNSLEIEDFLQISYSFDDEEVMQKELTILYLKIVSEIIDSHATQGFDNKGAVTLTSKISEINNNQIYDLNTINSSAEIKIEKVNKGLEIFVYLYQAINTWRLTYLS